MKNIINLTAVAVNLITDSGETITFPAAENPVKVETVEVSFSETSLPIPTVKIEYGDISNLPPYTKDSVYIVSAIAGKAIAEKYPERDDIYTLAGYVRDENGRITGATKLAKL